MQPQFTRADRLNSTIRKVLAPSLTELFKDGRGTLVTITDIKTSKDMRKAVVYLSLYGENLEMSQFFQKLDGLVPEFQQLLSKNLRSKRTPVLSFNLDDQSERSHRISELLNVGVTDTSRGRER